jgi:hypothetical protein
MPGPLIEPGRPHIQLSNCATVRSVAGGSGFRKMARVPSRLAREYLHVEVKDRFGAVSFFEVVSLRNDEQFIILS